MSRGEANGDVGPRVVLTQPTLGRALIVKCSGEEPLVDRLLQNWDVLAQVASRVGGGPFSGMNSYPRSSWLMSCCAVTMTTSPRPRRIEAVP